MKNLLRFSFFSFTLFSSAVLTAQQPDKFAYAVTDLQQNGSGWAALRKLNTKTGEYGSVLVNGMDASQAVFDAVSKKQLTGANTDKKTGFNLNTPFGTGVAAIAYDKKNNRIWYTPMFIDQLRYIDLKSNKLYYYTGIPFTNDGNMHSDEAKIITRMVVTPDGRGYAISNDANHFIRFSAGKKTAIAELGALIDDPSNNGVSIHNRCTSFGGDMIADNDGNLYIISARNHVFKVNIETKMAKHLGVINNLPANFTTNGAVVNEAGALLISSAVYNEAWYTVDVKTWNAEAYKAKAGVYRSSDLANSNILNTRNATANDIATLQRNDLPDGNKVAAYPNPVSDNVFALRFNKLEAGNYTIEVSDIMGRLTQQRRISINGNSQTENIKLDPAAARGVYLVKVADQNSKTVFTQKIVVQ
jgi:Secretion system C-terminal sorting domain